VSDALGMRVLRRPRVVIVAGVTAALVATDLAAGGISDFWSRHPMAAGVVSGLLLLGIGLWIVEGWVVEHGKPVVREAYRALATDLGTVAFVMRWCVQGSRDRPDAVPVGTGVDTECLQPVLEAMAAAPEGGYARRLKRLVRNDEWRDATVDVLRVCRRRLHDAAAGWATVMLTSPELADDLARVADLTEELGRVGSALAIEDIADEVFGMWEDVNNEATALEQRFYAAARDRGLDPRYAEPYEPRRRRVRAEAR
jgi:hypothetical protein